MALREQGLSLCPVYLFNAERGWDGGEGGGCWRCVVTDCAHWGETMSALILLWHKKTIVGGWVVVVGGLFTKLYYSALVSSPIWRVISWDGSIHEASHSTMGCFYHCATVGDFIFSEDGAPEFPVMTSYSNSRGHCSTDTGRCLQWKGSPASSHSQNPPSKRIAKEWEQKRWDIRWHFCTLKWVYCSTVW